MIMGPSLEKHKGLFCRTSQFVPNLCPKFVRDIKTYPTISKSIEILEPLKMSILQRNFIIFCGLSFSAASYTRVKSEVQVLYRPPCFSTTCTIPRPGKAAVVPKLRSIEGEMVSLSSRRLS